MDINDIGDPQTTVSDNTPVDWEIYHSKTRGSPVRYVWIGTQAKWMAFDTEDDMERYIDAIDDDEANDDAW